MNASKNPDELFDHKDRFLTRADIIQLARRASLTADDLVNPLPRVVKDKGDELHIERIDGETVRVLVLTDRKYGVLLTLRPGGDGVWGRLANLHTGIPIPDDEPVFILRGQDKLALAAIETYCRSVTDNGTTIEQLSGPTANDAFMAFQTFAQAHPDRMKLPS